MSRGAWTAEPDPPPAVPGASEPPIGLVKPLRGLACAVIHPPLCFRRAPCGFGGRKPPPERFEQFRLFRFPTGPDLARAFPDFLLAPQVPMVVRGSKRDAMSTESIKAQARRYERDEKWTRALELYLQVLEAQEGEDETEIGLYNRVGDLQIRLGDVDAAVVSYQQAIDLYAEAELTNNAIAICRKVIRNAPGRAFPYLRLGRIQAGQGFVVDARESFLRYAEKQERDGETEKALRALMEFVELVPDEIETRLFVAEQLASRGRKDEAADHLSTACRIAMEKGEEEKSAAIADRLRELVPDRSVPAPEWDESEPDPEPELGADLEGFESTALMDEAPPEDAAEGVVDLESKADATGFAEFSDISLELNGIEDEEFPSASGTDEAEPTPESSSLPSFDLEEDDGGDGTADLPLLADSETASLDEENGDESEPLPTFDLEDVTAEPEEEALARAEIEEWRAQGVALLSGGERHKGRELLEQAHRAFAEQGDPERAIQVVQTLLTDRPGHPELLQRLVEYAHQSKDRDLLVDALFDLAERLAEADEPGKSVATFRQILKLDPHHDGAREALSKSPPGRAGEGSDGSARWVVPKEASTGDEEADFARMLSLFKDQVTKNLSPEDSTTHYDLGMVYLEMGLFEEAIEEFRLSLRARPRNLAAFEVLGQCFLELGNPEEAIEILHEGVELPVGVEDDRVGIYYFLGRAHEEIRNTRAAIEFYEKVFSLDINFRDLTERLRSLR